MADEKDTQRLSTADKEKIIAFLKEKKSRGVCPKCGHQPLTIGDHLTAGTIVGREGGISLGGKVYPMAMVICENCFHVDFHLAVPIRVVEPDPESSKDG